MTEFEAFKNLGPDAQRYLIRSSKAQAVRRIEDPSSGDHWYWRAELATHAEGAKNLDIPYNKKPGEGDILTL